MRKKIIIIVILFVCFLSICMFISKSDNFTNKTINYNGNKLLVSIDGKNSDTLPTGGNYYLIKYKCGNKNTKVSWDRINNRLSVSNGNKKGGVACNLTFKYNPLLSEVSQGSYVAYSGDNGCSGKSCQGQNVNYVSDSDMGYCSSSNYKFIVSGWRVGYIEDDTAYLVSAGALECLCTTADGTLSTSCNSSNYETTYGTPIHTANLNNEALNYCNSDYAYGGKCDSSSSWSMNAIDFKKITGSVLSNSNCYSKYSTVSCGYNNDLIDNGGYYWYAASYSSSSSSYLFNWEPTYRYVYRHFSSGSYGLRPVLRLQSSVYVTGGSGTYEDPYTIANS